MSDLFSCFRLSVCLSVRPSCRCVCVCAVVVCCVLCCVIVVAHACTAESVYARDACTPHVTVGLTLLSVMLRSAGVGLAILVDVDVMGTDRSGKCLSGQRCWWACAHLRHRHASTGQTQPHREKFGSRRANRCVPGSSAQWQRRGGPFRAGLRTGPYWWGADLMESSCLAWRSLVAGPSRGCGVVVVSPSVLPLSPRGEKIATRVLCNVCLQCWCVQMGR